MSGFVVVTLLTLVLIALGWVFLNSEKGSIAVDRPDLEYSAFTTDHDIVCPAETLKNELSSRAVRIGAPAGFNGVPLDGRIQVAQSRLLSRRQDRPAWEGKRERNSAILILLDQSGSMAERMPTVAGDLLSAIEQLEDRSVKSALVGFTTVGWHGGRSRQDWIKAGKPTYPGRLCDLLHIIHKDFAGGLGLADLRSLLSVNSLFENVDGEALIWSSKHLSQFSASQKAMIVISDGAPVDDSTLQENGNGFLWRHLNQVVQELESDNEVRIGAVGLDHRIDGVYRNSRLVHGKDPLDTVILELSEELLRQT